MILCVNDIRLEHSLSIPRPTRLDHLDSLQQQHKQADKSTAYSNTHML